VSTIKRTRQTSPQALLISKIQEICLFQKINTFTTISCLFNDSKKIFKRPDLKRFTGLPLTIQKKFLNA